MKTSPPLTQRALTRLEVLLTVFILLCLAALVLPWLARRKAMELHVSCVNNLSIVGLSFRVFEADNQGKFPMEVSVTNGGSFELTFHSAEAWRQFQVLSNELSVASILHCPQDAQRQPAEVFGFRPDRTNAIVFSGNQYLSYFLSLNATAGQPQSVLAGDRNLATNGVAVNPGRLVITPKLALRHTTEIHNGIGNLLLADGSVQKSSSHPPTESWLAAPTNSALTTNVWLVP